MSTIPPPTSTLAPPSEPVIAGVCGKPVRVVSGLQRDATAAVLVPQFNGQSTPPLSTWPTTVSSEIDMLAVRILSRRHWIVELMTCGVLDLK